MGDRYVPHDVAVGRYERLRRVIERSSRLANEARIGRIEEIVVEGPSKKDPAVTSGRTRRNTLVHFASPSDRALPAGTYGRVEVIAAAANFLRGELVNIDPPSDPGGSTQSPSRRRIPVAVAS